MNAVELSQIYQWNYRPQSPRRPSWFTQWPHGNRIAVTFNIMHEWESVPRSNTVRKRAMSTGSTCLDFLALGAREYGAGHLDPCEGRRRQEVGLLVVRIEEVHQIGGFLLHDHSLDEGAAVHVHAHQKRSSRSSRSRLLVSAGRWSRGVTFR